MAKSKILKLTLSAALIGMGLIVPSSSRGAELKAEDIVAKHLDSLGTAPVRSAAKTRVVEGTAQYKVLVGGAGQAAGKAVLISEEHKIQLMMKFAETQYRGEQFIYNGDKFQVTATFSMFAEQRRSPFGQFLYVQDAIVREGLLGGVLATAWPLLNLQDRNPKLSYEGLKKIDGLELHDIRYRPMKSTDLEIHLYFEPETFHHVRSVYTLSVQPELRSEVENVRQQQTRYRLQERFSDFKTSDGLTLPTRYDVQFSQELTTGGTTLFEWDITANQISNNVTLDPRNFQVK